jgi:class 3 adenylate cyclase
MVQERPVRVERRLSAILVADVADYSRLVHREEEAAHAKPAAVLAESVTPVIAEHRGGRIEYRPLTVSCYPPNRGRGDLFFVYPTAGSAHVVR